VSAEAMLSFDAQLFEAADRVMARQCWLLLLLLLFLIHVNIHIYTLVPTLPMSTQNAAVVDEILRVVE
jgi:hypothetical protein